MATWIEVDPVNRENFHEWHTREHMPERLSIGGFLRGRRYIAIDADIIFFMFYETRNVDVLTGAEYLSHLNNPTPWSDRTVRTFGKNIRGVCDVRYSSGHADGGFLAAIRFDVASAEARERIASTEPLQLLLTMPQVCGIHLCVCGKSQSGTNTQLQSMRKIEVPDHIVMIEGCSAKAVADAASAIMKHQHYAGATSVHTGIYQLECTLDQPR